MMKGMEQQTIAILHSRAAHQKSPHLQALGTFGVFPLFTMLQREGRQEQVLKHKKMNFHDLILWSPSSGLHNLPQYSDILLKTGSCIRAS